MDKRGAALGTEVLAQQEVAIAVHDEYSHAGISKGFELGFHLRGKGRRIVIAYPDVEKVAEDEQGVGVNSVSCRKVEKALAMSGCSALRCRSEMHNTFSNNDMYRQERGFFGDRHRIDHNVFQRHVLVAHHGAGVAFLDAVHHVHTVSNLAEHGIAPALRSLLL